MLDSGYTNAVGAHWGLGLLSPERNQEFTDVLRWLADLGAMTHKGMLVRYFASQPGFLRDLIRYKVASRKVGRG